MSISALDLIFQHRIMRPSLKFSSTDFDEGA